MKFSIDITNSSGTRYGDGPILTAQSWETVTGVDRAGTFNFTMPANDPRAALLGKKRHAHCYTLIRGARTEIGEGIIDKISLQVVHDRVMLTVSGDNLMRELAYQRVGTLTIGAAGDPPTTSLTGPADIMALAPAGWTLDTTTGYDSTITPIFHEFDGDTVLAALSKLAELSGEHFRLGTGKTIVWMRTDQSDCGVVAKRKPPAVDMSPDPTVAWITDLTEEDDSYSQFSRIYPYGSGEGAARVIINTDTTWISPDADYEIVKAGGYIRRISVDEELRVDGDQPFKDITDTDSLASAAYQFLRTHSSVYNSYDLALVELNQAVTPGSTMRTIYRKVVNGYKVVDIDADLYILETTITLDTRGLRTSKIRASTMDRYAVDSIHMIVQNMMQSGIFSKNKQFLNGADVIGGAPGGSQPLDETLTAISELEDEEGDLHNDGEGGLSWENLQYIKHSLATAVNDFLVASGAGAYIKKTLAEVKTILGLGSAAYTASGDYAIAAKGVTNGDSHDHNGGDGAQIDHGGLGGLADDDHTQYIKHSLATAVNDFLVASGAGAYIKKTLAEVKTILGIPLLGSNGATLRSDGTNLVYTTQVLRRMFTAVVTDNVITSVFRIATTNESGNYDGGGYSVLIHAVIGNNLVAGSGASAVKSFTAQFCREMMNTGMGVNSVVSEVVETASAATTPATRDIGTVTMSLLETSEYQNDVQFLVDGIGSSGGTLTVTVEVELIWTGFLTPPVMSQL